MEALDGNSRQSGIHSIATREKIDRINTDRPYTSASIMAATAGVSPTSSMYSNGPPPPYSSGWSAPAAHSNSGLISPPESRRTSDNKTDVPPPPSLQPAAHPHRQSLPSIHEALSSSHGGPKPNPYASPLSANPPPSHQLPFAQQGPSIPRSYPASDHAPYPQHLAPRQPSPPQAAHAHANPFARPEPSSFSDLPRHPSVTSLHAPPAPHNPYAAPRYDPARYEQEQRGADSGPSAYTSHSGPPPQSSYTYGPPSSQGPPAGPPGPTFNQPRYQARDGRDFNGPWKGQRENEKDEQQGAPFRQGLKRHLGVWEFENFLAEINMSSHAITEWSGHYNQIAQEQQRRVNVIPDRMPTYESCQAMIQANEKIGECLKRMSHTIFEQERAAIADARMREQGGRPGDYDEEMSMYGDEMKNQGFGVSEGKKRRGRAAPPGRCHSCNRAETPEWRRGPDGARTLCNACGLHYAKLTRKNTMKQSQGSNGSSLRPKSIEELSPRPIQ